MSSSDLRRQLARATIIRGDAVTQRRVSRMPKPIRTASAHSGAGPRSNLRRTGPGRYLGMSDSSVRIELSCHVAWRNFASHPRLRLYACPAKLWPCRGALVAHLRAVRNEGIYRIERSSGSFRRVVALPEAAITDQAKATFRNGVLEITMRRRPSRSPADAVSRSTRKRNRSNERRCHGRPPARCPLPDRQVYCRFPIPFRSSLSGSPIA